VLADAAEHHPAEFLRSLRSPVGQLFTVLTVKTERFQFRLEFWRDTARTITFWPKKQVCSGKWREVSDVSDSLAERVRFELTEPLRARRFSRPLP
jgi:hypothetical protein